MPATAEAVALAQAAAAAADDRKALDPVLLEVADVLAVVDLFLIVSATSDRHLAAVVESVETALRDGGRRPLRREGTPEGGWVLLDYGDLVCHVFLAAEREHYALERLWSDVPHRDPVSGGVATRPRPRLASAEVRKSATGPEAVAAPVSTP